MNAPDWPWFCYWLVAFGLLGFGIAETWAVRRVRKGDTLSENVNYLVRKVPFGAQLLVLFMAWLTWHFTAGGGHRWDFWNWRPWNRTPTDTTTIDENTGGA